tara:strand:- start:899 stop:1135 length:237 start_codon:yes stop_codon:yes gene_type:complete
MALTDKDKEALEWASLVPGLLRAIGEATGDEGFGKAADALSKVPVDYIGAALGKLRTDHINIDKGTMSIGDDVDVEAG